ncbi:hypothetical protein HW555_005093 [Spodoptera exigua]|uniref:THAP-type domain-containing protein n=1 Tax=Spodoptera exigua TaxID=7107 RepID=A0A835L4V3_SPOEX|nr:hypothetical protein HW555_005093 [Spodoptera exigua]
MMNVYRWCAVPCCSSTSIKTPNKLFISVPMKPVIRNKWLILARRDPAAISPNSGIYFCEDHFDLPNDMQNYMRYHIMGSVPKVLMKSGCVPTKFECQQGKTKRLSDTAERSSVSKKSKKVLMDEKDIVKQSTTTTQLEFSGSSWHSPVQEQEEVEVKIENTEEYLIEAEENYQFESVQVDERFHDKEVQTKPELADKLVETWPVQSRSKAVQVNAPPEITVMELVKKETEKMMVRVYKYLCEELEVMKLMSAEEVMIGLEQVSSRAAHATGVSDLTMQRVLEENQIKTPQQPQNKRKRRKKRNNSHRFIENTQY